MTQKAWILFLQICPKRLTPHKIDFSYSAGEMHICYVRIPTSELADELIDFVVLWGCRDLKSELAWEILVEMIEVDSFLSSHARAFLRAVLRQAAQISTDFVFDFSAAFTRENIEPPDLQLRLF